MGTGIIDYIAGGPNPNSKPYYDPNDSRRGVWTPDGKYIGNDAAAYRKFNGEVAAPAASPRRAAVPAVAQVTQPPQTQPSQPQPTPAPQIQQVPTQSDGISPGWGAAGAGAIGYGAAKALDAARYIANPLSALPAQPAAATGIMGRIVPALKTGAGWLGRAAAKVAPAIAVGGGVTESLLQSPEERKRFADSVGAEGPIETAAADTLRTLGNVGSFGTGDFFPAIGRGLSEWASGKEGTGVGGTGFGGGNFMAGYNRMPVVPIAPSPPTSPRQGAVVAPTLNDVPRRPAAGGEAPQKKPYIEVIRGTNVSTAWPGGVPEGVDVAAVNKRLNQEHGTRYGDAVANASVENAEARGRFRDVLAANMRPRTASVVYDDEGRQTQTTEMGGIVGALPDVPQQGEGGTSSTDMWKLFEANQALMKEQRGVAKDINAAVASSAVPDLYRGAAAQWMQQHGVSPEEAPAVLEAAAQVQGPNTNLFGMGTPATVFKSLPPDPATTMGGPQGPTQGILAFYDALSRGHQQLLKARQLAGQ